MALCIVIFEFEIGSIGMRRLWRVLYWSVIAAAFIGPGTVTTAAAAGAKHGLTLLWALLFSTLACLVLQEAAARITVVSGLNLGQAIRRQCSVLPLGRFLPAAVASIIFLGCAAYEAGNLLGGVAGAALGTQFSGETLTLVIALAAGLLLWFGSIRLVVNTMGAVVGLMGLVFLITAILAQPPPLELAKGLFIPQIPPGGALLVLGLVGTTVVPYNLFLGSGIAAGQSLSELRFGLVVAIVLGGVISMGVVVVGYSIDGEFSFQAIATALTMRMGGWAAHFFSFGLFAAGFTSAITAPLAAAITAKSLLGKPDAPAWDEKSWRFRAVWLSVLLIGTIFGLLQIKPIPVIILAQALNGIFLPCAALFLFLIVNDKNLMGRDGINRLPANLATAAVVFVTLVLGVSSIARAAVAAMGISLPPEGVLLGASALLAVALAIPVQNWIRARRS